MKDAALEAIAIALEARIGEILEANELDMALGREAQIGDALLDRLRLDPGRVLAIAHAVRQIAALGDPVGEVIDGHRLANGLDVRRCVCRWASSPSSMRRGPMSRSMPPPCA
jgi:glutamate-5-semialdehyde dehydrogenase